VVAFRIDPAVADVVRPGILWLEGATVVERDARLDPVLAAAEAAVRADPPEDAAAVRTMYKRLGLDPNFFLVYVIGFHYEGPAAWPGRAALPQSDALILHRVILVLLMLTAVLGYVAAQRQNPPGPLAAALTFYVLMQISYAHYLLRIFRTGARRQVTS
jgi:hypothetical protein